MFALHKLQAIMNLPGRLLKATYSIQDDTYDNWKYFYFFFYQRVLMFNIHVPWPCHPTSTVTGVGGIKFGKRTSPGSGPNQYIQGANGIIFGDNVQIGPSVSIISANHDPSDYNLHLSSPPVIIGSNVWIGANCVVLPGVKIGSNVIIGAGSIVNRDIPSDSIAVGNPCRKIKSKSPYTFA
jgi:acetyltransferase-like isoleucine patch superfamily enzyme